MAVSISAHDRCTRKAPQGHARSDKLVVAMMKERKKQKSIILCSNYSRFQCTCTIVDFAIFGLVIIHMVSMVLPQLISCMHSSMVL